MIPGAKARNERPGKCKLTEDNFAGATYLLKQQWPASAQIIEQLTLPAALCLECLPSEARSKITIRRNGRRSEAELLVGLPAAMWDDSLQSCGQRCCLQSRLLLHLPPYHWRHRPRPLLGHRPHLPQFPRLLHRWCHLRRHPQRHRFSCAFRCAFIREGGVADCLAALVECVFIVCFCTLHLKP